MQAELLDKLWEYFKVYEEYKEFETWTERGYNVVLSVESWTKENILKAVEEFDPCDTIVRWWNNDSFKENYNHSLREALDDLEGWKYEMLNNLKAVFYGTAVELVNQ